MKKMLTVIQALLILIFIACAVFIGLYFYSAHRSSKSFDMIKAEVEANKPVDASGNYEEKYADNGMLLQYYELYEQNNDMTGWLKIPGTVVDYPVVQADNNEFYLHRDFYKKYQYSGIPFLDYQCDANSKNYIIYAHHMKNGTMFAPVSKYQNEDFYRQHKRIIFDTLYERGQYEIIAVFRITVGSVNEFKYYNYVDLDTEDRFNEYVNTAMSLSLYETGNTASYGDALLTLSTCAYNTSNERFVVVARKKT